MITSILVSLSALFGFWGIYLYLGYRARKRQWKQKVSQWYQNDGRTSYIVIVGNKFDQTELAKPIKEKLQKANINLTPSEFYGILLVGAIGAAYLLFYMLDIAVPYNILGGFIAMEVIKRLLFFFRRNKYQERLNEQLSDVCRFLANATRAGMTLNQGIHNAAMELNYPVSEEFKRLSQELKLGIDFRKALTNMQNRIPSREFKLFIAVLLIQKKAGGNLYSALDEMAQTLEERKVLNQAINTATAEQRYVANILPLMPVLLLIIMNNIIDGFMKPLFSPIGLFLLAIFLFGSILAFVLIKKVTNIKV